MYIDFMTQKVSNNKEKFLNTFLNPIIKPNILKKDDIMEHYSIIDPSLNYIIKRNYANINNASCFKSDITDIDNNKCYMTSKIFYPLQTYIDKCYTISASPYSINNTFYTNMNTTDSSKSPYPYNGPNNYRESNFLFSNEKGSRNINPEGLLESIIYTYISNYVNYYNVTNDKNSNIKNGTDIDLKTKEIYCENIRDILLLKPNVELFPNDKKENYNIPNIYETINLLIEKYEQFYKDPQNSYPDADLLITNNSKLIVLIDPLTFSTNVETNSVYSLVLKINISINLTNLTPVNVKNQKNIYDFNSFCDNFHHLIYDKKASYVYTYDKQIYFPILLPFNLPKKINETTVDENDHKWSENIINYFNTVFIDNQLNLRNKVPISGNISDAIKNGIDSLKYDMKIINSIKNIFAIFVPKNNEFENKEGVFTFIIQLTTEDVSNNKNIYVVEIDTSYNPNFCTDVNTILYNQKCLPKCPPNFNIDLGLVCLNSDISKFTPNSDLCTYVNNINKTDISEDSMLSGIIHACDNELYNNTLKNPIKADISIKGYTDKGGKLILNNSDLVQGATSNTRLENAPNDKNSDKNSDIYHEQGKEPEILFTNVPTKNIQHFGNIPNNYLNSSNLSVSNDIIIDSRPIIQNNIKPKHFYPFEN